MRKAEEKREKKAVQPAKETTAKRNTVLHLQKERIERDLSHEEGGWQDHCYWWLEPCGKREQEAGRSAAGEKEWHYYSCTSVLIAAQIERWRRREAPSEQGSGDCLPCSHCGWQIDAEEAT
jgi:hypothetical protein